MEIEQGIEWGEPILPDIPDTYLPMDIIQQDVKDRLEVGDYKGPVHLERPIVFAPIADSVERLAKRSILRRSSRSRSPSPRGRPSNKSRSRSRDRLPTSTEDEDETEISPIGPISPLENKSDDGSQKSDESIKSVHSAVRVVNLIKNWARRFKARDNETIVRNKYYQFMMNLIFTHPFPLVKFFSSLDRVRFLVKDSMSDSVCMTGHIKPTPGMPKGLNVFVKMTKRYDASNKFKEIEPRIYRDAVNKLIYNRLSPHVMMYLGSVNVFNWENALKKTHQFQIGWDVQQKMLQTFGPFEKGKSGGGDLLVTECGNGISLKDFMATVGNSQENQEEFVKIMFQVLYTLHVMDQEKLTHYDLHLGNIFLEKIDPAAPPQTFVYFIGRDSYVTLTLGKYFVRLFDWDMAYKPRVATSSEEKSRRGWPCKNYGMCNVHKSEYDTHKFLILAHRYKQSLSPTITTFIEHQYGNELDQDMNKNLMQRKKCDGHHCREDSLCEIVKVGGIPTCKGEWKSRPYAIQSSGQIFHNLIHKFKSNDSAHPFMVHDITSFDLHYLPGTFKWINYVFAPSTDLMVDMQEKLKQSYVNKTLTSINF